MHKVRTIILCILMITLCGCSQTAVSAEEIQGGFKALDEFKCRMSADFDGGDTVTRYGLSVTQTGNKTRMTVTEPEELSGLSATVSENGKKATLEFDGAIFAVTPPSDGMPSPLLTLPVLLRSISDGIVKSIRPETVGNTECVVMEVTANVCDVPHDFTHYIDAARMLPVRSEAALDGKRIIVCTFEQTSGE